MPLLEVETILPKELLGSKRIAQLLVDKGVVSADQLRIALLEQQQNGERLERILARLGFVTNAVMREVVSGTLGYDSVDLENALIDNEVIDLIPRDIARRFHLIPLTCESSEGHPSTTMLTLAIADPLNVLALDQVRLLLPQHFNIRLLVASELEIDRAIERFYGYDLSIGGILHEIESGNAQYSNASGRDNEYAQPIVRLVNALLIQAVKRGASDIHFEPEQGFLRVRYRIDGVLQLLNCLHRNYLSAIVVRLKVMANINIAESRAPQDGHFALTVFGKAIDFRISCFPTAYGENIVLRVLDREKGIVPLEQLGLSEVALHNLQQMVARPYGIILVTGPTGSGKTTTLYSMINYMNSEQVNIMTLEDPVEYPLDMIRQTSINESVKLTFANGVRSLLRQDPDIILIGEIRDKQTAEFSFQAAMTGHLVFSTVHTSSAIGSIARLRELGVLADIMAGNIIGVIGQRLVRRLCPHCKQAYTPDAKMRTWLSIDPDALPVTIYRSSDGCKDCDYRGYKGRMVFAELLVFDAVLDDLIEHKATRHELHNAALAKGFSPLLKEGVRCVLDGKTSFSEVSRMVDFYS